MFKKIYVRAVQGEETDSRQEAGAEMVNALNLKRDEKYENLTNGEKRKPMNILAVICFKSKENRRINL